jgi:hypothetical protein
MDCLNEGLGIYLHNYETEASKISGFTILRSEGGAVYCRHASPVIGHMILANNRSAYGAGVHLAYSTAMLNDIKILDNVSAVDGGGFYAFDSDVEMTAVVVSGNWANWGGGIRCHMSTLRMNRCTVSGNCAAWDGGAMYAFVNCTLIISDCSFEDNHTTQGQGGAIWLSGGITGAIENVLITGNEADDGFAGGLYCEGSATAIVFRNVVFSDNVAAHEAGGALVTFSSHPQFINCTFSRNACTDPGHGSGISIGRSAEPLLSNSIVAYNGQGYGIFTYDGAAPLITCSNVYGNEGVDYAGQIPDQTGINGNISEDPQFCGLPDDNYYLQSDSPCIPVNNDCATLMGAWGVGCGDVRVEATSWSAIKQRF